MSGQTDEGVDLTEMPKCSYSKYAADDQSKCAFYEDCLCNYASDCITTITTLDYSGSSTSGSLNSGSEFEEFLPVKGMTKVTQSKIELLTIHEMMNYWQV